MSDAESGGSTGGAKHSLGLVDLVALLGVAAVLYGVWQTHPPAAWIVGGSGLFTAAYRLRA